VKPLRIIVAAVMVGAGLPLSYVALGGGSYSTPGVADPCVTREWRNPDGLDRTLEQIVLSALDGAACDLGVTRETLALALADEGSRARFARQHGIDDGRLEDEVQKGLVRAVDDAEHAGALAGWQATLLRAAASRVPAEQVLNVVDILT